MPNEIIFISGFIVFIGLMLAIDLGLFGKSGKAVSMKRAGIMSAVWITLALCFYALIFKFGHLLHHVDSFSVLQQINDSNFHHLTLNPNNYAASLALYRKNLALEFITGYVVEYALSVDNIFVMVLIFTAFAVDKKHYHKVLFWGIVGAVLMRFAFIFMGSALIAQFHWILYLFGAFLVYTGIKMFKQEETEIQPEHNPVVRLVTRFLPITRYYEESRFFTKVGRRRTGTLLLLVLIVVEVTDLVFAVDSIPAIFAITTNTFIVYTSNVFAILGLRMMYFALAGLLDRFEYLKVSLALILMLVGVKIIAGHWIRAAMGEYATLFLLGAVAVMIAGGIIASLVVTRRREKAEAASSSETGLPSDAVRF